MIVLLFCSLLMQVLEGKPIYVDCFGNLVPLIKSGQHHIFSFYAFKENRLPLFVKVNFMLSFWGNCSVVIIENQAGMMLYLFVYFINRLPFSLRKKGGLHSINQCNQQGERSVKQCSRTRITAV